MIRPEDVTLFVRSAAPGRFSRAARQAAILPGLASDVFRDPVDGAIRYGVREISSYVALPLANRRA